MAWTTATWRSTETRRRWRTIEIEKNLVSIWVMPQTAVFWIAEQAKYKGIPITPLSKSENAKLPRIKFVTVRRDFTFTVRNKIREFNAAVKMARSNGNVSNSGLKPRIFCSSSSIPFSRSFWRLLVELSILKKIRAHICADSELLIAIVTYENKLMANKAFKRKTVDVRHQTRCRNKVCMSLARNGGINKTKNWWKFSI